MGRLMAGKACPRASAGTAPAVTSTVFLFPRVDRAICIQMQASPFIFRKEL